MPGGRGGRVRARRAVRRVGRRAGRVRGLAATRHGGLGRRRCAELAGMLPAAPRRAERRRRRVADERYRAHRAVRAPAGAAGRGRQPLVLVLDDLHWGDRASIELVAALLRRGPAAPVLLALGLPPGPGAGAADGGAGRAGAARGSSSASSARREAARAARRRGRAGAGRRSTATAAATRSTSSSSPARASRPAAGALGRGAAAGGRRCPRRGGGRAGRGARVALAAGARAAERRGGGGRAVRARPGGGGRPSCPRRRGWRRWTTCWSATWCGPPQVPRQFVFRHPLVRRAVLRVHPRRLAAGRPRARGRGPGRPRRRRRPSARTTWSSRPARATRPRSRCCWRRATAAPRARPAAAARWFEAALRLLPAATASARSTCGVALASALRSVGELEACRGDAAGGHRAAARRRGGAAGAS